MRPTNDTDQEHNVLIALELYRLQSLRNTLLLVLVVQLLLVGIALTMVFEANKFSPVPTRISPSPPASEKEHDGLRPTQLYHAANHRQVVVW